MRAMVIEEFGGPLVAKDVPIPEPGPGEVLIAVRACAVDRFDVAIRKGRRERSTFPHILGHEISGQVAEVGEGVTKWDIGDRIAATLYLVCGTCRWCRSGRETICENFGGHVGVAIPGGYAEYLVLPEHNLVSLPDSIDFPAGSILANAIGTPYHALKYRMNLQPGEKLIVTGAGGGVGLHAVQLGVMLGAEVMAVDMGHAKLSKAKELGAAITIDPRVQKIRDAASRWTSGVGVDGVLELVGPATMPETLASLAKGGRMVIVGSHSGAEWSIDPGDIYRNEWEIKGSRNVSATELAEVIELVADGAITPIVAGTFPLEEAESLQKRVTTGKAVGREILIP